MEAKFKSLSLFEFQEKFPDDDSCLEYLAGIKWADGFKCPKCGNTKYCRGTRKFDRQCTCCKISFSPTSGTLFHRCKFSLKKAFYIVYYISTSKKGMSSTELSRKLALRQKTCWLFRQKVQKAMQSSKSNPMTGKVDVDETYIGGQDEQAIGRSKGKKKLVVVAIEKKGKGISRMYAKEIQSASNKNLGTFMRDHIKTDAALRTDKWTGYNVLSDEFINLQQEKSEKKGKNFKEIHRSIMLFKGWLRGMHHSVKHLQPYLDEYTYRLNRHKMKDGIFENLINRMMKSIPWTCKMIIS